MHIIDPEDILKQVAAIKERTKEALNKPGQDGVNARLEHEIGSALFAWRARESNRQTDPSEVTEGLISLATSNLGAHMLDHVCVDHYADFAVSVANDLLRNLILLGQSTDEQRSQFAQFIPSKEMGVA